ncbi:unnamed protein product [Arabidopsis halleri]
MWPPPIHSTLPLPFIPHLLRRSSPNSPPKEELRYSTESSSINATSPALR